jgi:hypothetical protein
MCGKNLPGLLLVSVSLFGQISGATEFEVASIKPNVRDDRIVTIDVGPGRVFSARGYSLKLLIQRAFGVKGYQIGGGPAWLDVDRYDLAARAPAGTGNLTEAELRPDVAGAAERPLPATFPQCIEGDVWSCAEDRGQLEDEAFRQN